MRDSKDVPIYRLCCIGSKFKETALICNSQITLEISTAVEEWIINLSLKWSSEIFNEEWPRTCMLLLSLNLENTTWKLKTLNKSIHLFREVNKGVTY